VCVGGGLLFYGPPGVITARRRHCAGDLRLQERRSEPAIARKSSKHDVLPCLGVKK